MKNRPFVRWLFVPLLAAPVVAQSNGRLHNDPDSRRERVTPIVEVVREVGPTVVNLYASIEYREFLGFRNEASSLGAGVIVHPSGLVVTNAHVLTANIEQGRITDIEVSYRPVWIGTDSAKMQRFKAKVLGFNRQNDLALLKIDAEGPFSTARLGTSSDLMVGETVVAVGNPFGREGSVTHGIISATNRRLEGPTGDEFDDLIQTDAPLNAGNSGGPLFNILGELIGVNQAIGADSRLGRAEGQGLAIPADRVRQLLETQFSAYELRHWFTGLSMADDEGEGLRIDSVDDPSPAAAAGLRAGERILKVGEYEVGDLVAFNLSLLDVPEGRGVPLIVQSDRRRRTVEIQPVIFEDLIEKRLGLRVDKNPRDPAPVVASVEAGSSAERVGMVRGDLLMSFAGRRVSSVQDLFEFLQRTPAGEIVDVVIRRRRTRSSYTDYRGKLEA